MGELVARKIRRTRGGPAWRWVARSAIPPRWPLCANRLERFSAWSHDVVAPLEPVRPERMGQTQSPRPRIIRRARQERRNSSCGLDCRGRWHALRAYAEAVRPYCRGRAPALKNRPLESAVTVCVLEVADVFNRRSIDENARSFRNEAVTSDGRASAQ